jgi:N-terminal acetyltransferase B complex non-catalytic subunit
LGNHQPPITDLPFLSYIYTLLTEAVRRLEADNAFRLVSVGNKGLEAWQNAAKTLSNRNFRMNLWSELFVTAMRQELWEDVRFAIVQANKESPAEKKITYYSFILANQLCAEARENDSKASHTSDKQTNVQFLVALQKMKEAYEGSARLPDQTVRVSDMRDLRFMASIYSRQRRVGDLFELWQNPPANLRKVFEDHELDILILKADVAQACGEWGLLSELCGNVITRELEPTGSIARISSVAWTIWSGFVKAIQETNPPSEYVMPAFGPQQCMLT